MKVVIINGFAGVGKSTFVEFCRAEGRKFGNVFELSTIDPIKDIARKIGWDGQKTPKSRKFLSDLKDLLTEFNDYPHRAILKLMAQINGYAEDEDMIFFIHCREPEEIQRFKQEFGAKTLLIRRADAEGVAQFNHADNGVFNFQYDFEIVNDGTLEDFKEKAIYFMEKVKEF